MHTMAAHLQTLLQTQAACPRYGFSTVMLEYRAYVRFLVECVFVVNVFASLACAVRRYLPSQNPHIQGQVAIKADPVDSTMHEATGGSAQEAALEHHNGPSLLHGASSVSMVKLLQVMASLFPEAGGEDSWHDLADAAAKEEGCVLCYVCQAS